MFANEKSTRNSKGTLLPILIFSGIFSVISCNDNITSVFILAIHSENNEPVVHRQTETTKAY